MHFLCFEVRIRHLFFDKLSSIGGRLESVPVKLAKLLGMAKWFEEIAQQKQQTTAMGIRAENGKNLVGCGCGAAGRD